MILIRTKCMLRTCMPNTIYIHYTCTCTYTIYSVLIVSTFAHSVECCFLRMIWEILISTHKRCMRVYVAYRGVYRCVKLHVKIMKYCITMDRRGILDCRVVTVT